MGKISVNNLEEGMVLLADVKSGAQVLLAQGATLSLKNISILKSWGVISVEIDGASEQQLKSDELKKIPPQKLKKIENKLKVKFSHVDLKFYPAAVLYKACLLAKIK